MSSEDDPKVSVDIGLGAKASLEARVSTEIPPQSSGRALDALTDIIRPFSERRGLKADLIRLQREEVAIEIAQRAHHRLEIENQPINPLPNKFLVPFLEKASLEELDGVMLDRWADLLASSSADPWSAHPRFIQLLSEIGADEARLLRRIALNNIDEHPEPFIGTSEHPFPPDVISEFLNSIATETDEELRFLAEQTRDWVLQNFHRPGILLTEILIAYRSGGKLGGKPISVTLPDAFFPHLTDEDKLTSILLSRDVLISLGLLGTRRLDISDDRFAAGSWVSYIYLTPLAAGFLKKCDRDLARQLRAL